MPIPTVREEDCTHCPAPLLWVKTRNDKTMPLDREPVENGNVTIRDGLVHVASKADPIKPGELRYTHHRVTCPRAREWHPGKATPSKPDRPGRPQRRRPAQEQRPAGGLW